MTSEHVNATLHRLALGVSATLGAERACMQATFVLVEAAATLGISLTPLATSVFAIDWQTGASVSFGTKSHEFRCAYLGYGDPNWTPPALFPQAHMIARCDETGWMFDATVGQVQASNVPIPSPVLAFAPPELRDGAWLLRYEINGGDEGGLLAYLPYLDDDSWRPLYNEMGQAVAGFGTTLARGPSTDHPPPRAPDSCASSVT
jgi:hypothetical protein